MNDQKEGLQDWKPVISDLNFGLDLLGLHGGEEIRPLSPSRIGDLMVSPLAWLLAWMDMEPKEWAPEEPGVIILGSLAHGVFENLFLPDQPLPSETAIRSQVPSLLDQEIRQE